MSLIHRMLARIRTWLGIEWMREAQQIAEDARAERYQPTGNPIADRYRGLHPGRGNHHA
jgi:hypothetical protein